MKKFKKSTNKKKKEKKRKKKMHLLFKMVWVGVEIVSSIKSPNHGGDGFNSKF